MFELLFLLLPIAAAYGWYMGRRSAIERQQQETHKLSRNYVQGVNLLLSNQQDKAENLFLEILKKDTATFEAHLTLGNLFSSRGEVDRAIRMHRSLLESGLLTIEQELMVQQQLGKDYIAAGLFDRAENVFIQLVEENDFRFTALQQLLTLYQSVSDWYKAIDVAEKLMKQGEINLNIEIAHFHCEIAKSFINQQSEKTDKKIIELLNKALSFDEHCVRASIMLGRCFMEKEAFSLAIDKFVCVAAQDMDFVCEILDPLHHCYQHEHRLNEWKAFITESIKKNAGSRAVLHLADLVEQEEGIDMAQLLIKKQLQLRPSMKLFHQLIKYNIAEAEEGKAKESFLLLSKLVNDQIRIKPRYRCAKCGFTANTLYWHCPSCRSWSTVKPIHGLDGE